MPDDLLNRHKIRGGSGLHDPVVNITLSAYESLNTSATVSRKTGPPGGYRLDSDSVIVHGLEWHDANSNASCRERLPMRHKLPTPGANHEEDVR